MGRAARPQRLSVVMRNAARVLPRVGDMANNLIHSDPVFYLRKYKRSVPAHFPGVALHHRQVGAHPGGLFARDVPVDAYGEDLERKLADLHGRIHRGAYRAQPSRRVYIPKPDGRERPLGIAALEDKIVQRALVEVLNAIWEEDFLGFSYGFRPGRGQHDALYALAVGIAQRKVNWILDADIAGFFDAVSHDWLVKFVEHRVGDRRVVRLIRKWLKAGVMEDGQVTPGEVGTPQGAVISPLLANIYLHFVFDLWAEQRRKRHPSSTMSTDFWRRTNRRSIGESTSSCHRGAAVSRRANSAAAS